MSTTNRALSLQPDLVRQHVSTLQQRIFARFPERALGAIAGELLTLVDRVDAGRETARTSIRRATLIGRSLSFLIVGAAVVALGLTLRDALDTGPETSFEWLPIIESTINDVIFAAIAVLFLWALPERAQRRDLLSLLHELRSLAHVIDVHQLTKVPEQVQPGYHPTDASVVNTLDAEGMRHYFDYCSELLSLVSKTAALCAEISNDAVVLSTVSTLESLTTNMSSKIWQKISLLPA